jgi:hypothetical protein
MARTLNSEGKLILSELSMEEKTEIILEIWNFLEQVASTFSREFDPISAHDGDELADSLNEIGFDDNAQRIYFEDHIWTVQGSNSDIVSLGGIDFGVWGTAVVPRYISLEEDEDQWVRRWFLSRVSRAKAQGLYRDVYSQACPENPNLPLSESEKSGTWFDKSKQEYFQFAWNEAPYVWERPYVKCPFCSPLDGQSVVDCPVNEARLSHLADEHEWSQSFSLPEDGLF